MAKKKIDKNKKGAILKLRMIVGAGPAVYGDFYLSDCRKTLLVARRVATPTVDASLSAFSF